MSGRIVVAGGGAAGMMAAITAARAGARVLLLEPNEKVGRKLYITGKGRCNVTNNCSQEELLASIPRNGKFLYSALSRFSPQAVMAFFEELGVPLKTERGGRVFPRSDKAADIVDALFFRAAPPGRGSEAGPPDRPAGSGRAARRGDGGGRGNHQRL